MNTGEELEKLIEEWKFLHLKGKLERFGKKPRIVELRKKFLEILGDKQLLILKEVVLQRQVHANYETVAVWEKSKWEDAQQRKLEWEQRTLKWLK